MVANVISRPVKFSQNKTRSINFFVIKMALTKRIKIYFRKTY